MKRDASNWSGIRWMVCDECGTRFQEWCRDLHTMSSEVCAIQDCEGTARPDFGLPVQPEPFKNQNPWMVPGSVVVGGKR